MDFLKGYKTYIGLFISMMGMLSAQLGWDWWNAVSGDVQAALNQLAAFGGLAFAVYGKFMAAKREKKLESGG
jgi:hypothetical protein